MMKIMSNWFSRILAKWQLNSALEEDFQFMNDAGGTDMVCEVFLHMIAKDAENWRKFRNGTLDQKEYPMRRTLVSFAAIESMMQARKGLAYSDDPESISLLKLRLETAESAFLLSFLLIPDNEKENGENFADSRLSEGEKALSIWRSTDPNTFPIVVQVEKTSPNIDALKKYSHSK
jgi:hypothetical protein